MQLKSRVQGQNKQFIKSEYTQSKKRSRKTQERVALFYMVLYKYGNRLNQYMQNIKDISEKRGFEDSDFSKSRCHTH